MENKRAGERGMLSGIFEMIRGGIEGRRGNGTAILFDAIIITVSFLLSGCHIAFGAYPLGTAFVAVLPRGVWLALAGAVAGSLSLGRRGVICAVMVVIVVFLRVIISGGERKEERGLFCEPLVLRISAAAIGAFVGAVYEALLSGFAFKSVLYGVSGIILSALFTFAFSGILDGGVSFSEALFSGRNVFAQRGENEKFGIYLFQGTFLLFVFLISLSLKKYNVLGISPAYMFSSFITLFVARRFGTARAIATGFVSSLAVSSTYSVAFALVGLGAGVLSPLGLLYSVIGGGVLLSVWSAYTGGAIGFLSTLPEYVSAALLSTPLLRRVMSSAAVVEQASAGSGVASDMVASTALAYKSAESSGAGFIGTSLAQISPILKRLGREEGVATAEEYRDMVIETTHRFCVLCHFYNSCVAENPAPCAENMDLIATKLYKKERLLSEHTSLVPQYCHNSGALFEELSRAAGELESEKYRGKKTEALAEEYELISALISESQREASEERAVDVQLGDKICALLSEIGIANGSAKVLGKRKKHFIIAGEDKDGSLITSPRFHKGIEEIADVRLGTPDYYRKGEIALFECSASPRYILDFASVGRASTPDGVSGDSATSFECPDGHFYSLISDGMGSGEGARGVSLFCTEFLSSVLSASPTKRTALCVLNHILRNKSEECSATVDLFDFDLYTGEAVFYKCGAAASYIKRDNSIFRIRSETAPLGLMKKIDAERVRVEVKEGDCVVMLSDGISQSPEDSTWLLELLNKHSAADARGLAEEILSASDKYGTGRDDRSVSVIRVRMQH